MATVFVQLFEKLPFHPIAILPFLCFIIILYKQLYTKNQLPSPRKLPIIGNLHQLGALPHRSLGSLSKKYGDLMLLHLGSKPTLVVSSAYAAEAIMKTHDIVFVNRPESRVSSILFYDGMDIAFGKYREYWRQIKSLCVTHMLSNKKVQSFRKVREEEVSLIVERIRKTAPFVPVNLTETFASLANNVVSRAAFGRKYNGEEGCGNIKELMNDFVAALGTFSVGRFIPWLSWIDQATGLVGKATRVAKAIDEFLDKIVQEHIDRRNIQSQIGDEGTIEDEVQDLVDVVLDFQRTNQSLTRVDVKAILIDMLVGGIEPTATLIEWTMSELLKHPQIMKQLQDEVRGFVKGKAIIDEDDLKNMTYLKAVIKEAARLHPSAPLLLFREASKDVRVHKYDIAAGTQVIINAWAIQRQPASWDKPEEFRPERFLNSTIDMKGNNFELIPFGAGRRGCPGMAFASMQTELILANLAGMFDWEVPGFEQLRLLCLQPLTVLPLIIFIYFLYKWVFYTKIWFQQKLASIPTKAPDFRQPPSTWDVPSSRTQIPL